MSELVEITGLLDEVNERAEQTDTSEDHSGNHAADLLKSKGTNGTFTTGKDFVAEVESVTFSSPDLVSISKVEEDTTIGAIKERLGLVCEYSAELTEDEIAEINGSAVAAGDWALISLKPFTSEETLTVKMVNGDVWTVKVTDAKSYTVTFNVNDSLGGVVVANNVKGSTLSVAVTNDGLTQYETFPRKESAYTNGAYQSNSGWRFVYWTRNIGEIISSYKREQYKSLQPDNVEEATTYTSNFVPENEKLVLYVTEDGGTINSSRYYTANDGTQFFNYSGDDSGAKATPNDRYTFDGWYIGGEKVSSNETFDLSLVSEDCIVTAKYLPPVTITYTTERVDTSSNVGRVRKNDEGSTVAGSITETAKAGGETIGAVAVDVDKGKFIYWKDSEGTIVSTNRTFAPSGIQTKTTTYTAVFAHVGTAVLFSTNNPIVAKFAQTSGGQPTGTIINSNTRSGSYPNATYSAWTNDNLKIGTHANVGKTNYSADYELMYWEILYDDDEKTYKDYKESIKPIDITDKTALAIIAYVKPANTFQVQYVATSGGTINNTTDYAGSSTAKGATATANIGDGYHFLGWYIGERRLGTNETITADDLITWKNAGYISADFTTITARFGAGYTITYQKQINDATPTEISSELVTSSAPNGAVAEPHVGHTFLGWYKGDEFVTENATLTANDIGDVSSNMTFTAKYITTRVATYEAEHVNAAKAGVSTYGQIVVGSESTTLSATQNANAENVLSSGATAIPARGCEFVKWIVTDEDGTLSDADILSQYGFSADSATIPAGTTIPSNVTFKAQFRKQSGAMEIIYTIQQDDDPTSHAARLTVNGKSVEGYGDKTAYISEVVPVGEAALGCAAEGLNYSGQDYKIRGWVLGDDNDSKYNKDTLFTRTTSFTPIGEYLEDIDGNGVRYFRVVTKKEKNVYIMFRVSDSKAGYIAHSSSDTHQEDVLHHINAEGDFETGANGELHMRSYEQVFNTESNYTFNNASRTGVAYYGVYINTGYKLVGFTFNGMTLSLKEPITKSGQKIKPSSFTIINPDWKEGDSEDNHYIDLINYLNEHSKLLLPEVNTKVNENEHINILVANFASDAFNIEYHVKNGIGGELSKYGELFTANDKETPGFAIIGSTAVADTDNDYVFVRWEDAEGNTVSTDPYYAPSVNDITRTSPYVYHYYAVFERREKLDVFYKPDDPSHGVTDPVSETVHQGVPANGSQATAYDGYVFSHWTRKGSEDVISTNQNFIPNIYDVSATDIDHVTAEDFTNHNDVTFIAHFRPVVDSKITVSKVVQVSGELAKNNVDTVIYIGLTRNGVTVTDRDGQPLIREIVVENGTPKNTVTFEGLPYNDLSKPNDKYEVWEMHKVGSVYERQYVGMLIGDDYQLSAISTSNNSSYNATEKTYSNGSGNNAILTEDHKEATVKLTNTYSKEKDTVSFKVIKEWQNSDGQALTGASIPSGAKVEMTVYSENNGVTRAVKSIWLDGIVDDKGEAEEWKATFENLPKYASDGTTELTYKVRETGLWEGYKPYINGGSTYLSENLYLYNNGGKIINKADKENTTLITVQKVDKQDVSKLLEGATFYLSKKTDSNVYALFDDGSHADGIYSVGGVGDGLGLFSVALPDGEYQLQEKESPAGYVVVTGAFDFKIEKGNLIGTTNGEYISFDSNNMMITIKNERGVELPSTGGPGTKLFTILGSILVAGAGVMLMMRRRRLV